MDSVGTPAPNNHKLPFEDQKLLSTEFEYTTCLKEPHE